MIVVALVQRKAALAGRKSATSTRRSVEVRLQSRQLARGERADV